MHISKTLIYLKTFNLAKLTNLSKICISYFASVILKHPIRWGFPFSLSVEPTTYCNLNCSECPVGNNSLKRPKGEMSLVLFKKIIDQSAKYLLNLFIYFQGEPFLNKNIFRFISYAKNKNITTVCSTNGHFLTESNIRQLIESQLDILIISLDGTDQISYEKYRKGGNLKLVIEGIRRLSLMKKNLKSKKPFIEIQFIVFKHNEHQINEIKKLARILDVDNISIKTAQIYNFQNNSELIPSNKKYSRYIKKNNKWTLKKKLKNRCFRLWNSCVVTWDGFVLPCCFDKNADYAFGNIKNQKIKNIINNDNFKKFASEVLTDRSKIDICNNCSE